MLTTRRHSVHTGCIPKVRSLPALLAMIVGLAASATPSVAAADDPALPQARVTNIRRAFHNGEHNAFTDLCRFRGRYYLTFRSCPDGHGVHPTSSILVLASDDGLVWKHLGLFQEDFGDETAFLFDDDGAALAIARSGGGRNAQVCRSQPPYDTWQRVDLDRYIGGPLLVRWGEHDLVGGRKTLDGQSKTALYWLVDDRLVDLAELPSGGDNSYPGFVELGPGRALVSWYSSHEQDAEGRTITAIYLAELTLPGSEAIER